MNVAAGAYAESVTLGRPVALLGAQADTDVATRAIDSGAEAVVTGRITVDLDDKDQVLLEFPEPPDAAPTAAPETVEVE